MSATDRDIPGRSRIVAATLENSVVMNLTVTVPVGVGYSVFDALEFCREVYENARGQGNVSGTIELPKGVIEIK